MLKRARNIQLVYFRKKDRKWDRRGYQYTPCAMKTMLCKASHCVAQGWGGIGRHQYTVFDRQGPRCAHMPDLCPSAGSTLLICPHSSLLCSMPSHVHRCLSSGYMPALQSAPRLNCVVSFQPVLFKLCRPSHWLKGPRRGRA